MFLDVFLVLVMFFVATPLFGAGMAVSAVAAVDAIEENEPRMFWLSAFASFIGMGLTLVALALGIVLLVGLF